MTTLRSFVLIYFFGGLTFIPFIVLILFYAISTPKQEDHTGKGPSLLVDVDPEFEEGELNEFKGVAAKKQGWLHMTRRFYPHQTDVVGANDDDDNDSNSSNEQLTRNKLKKKDRFYGVLKHGNLFLYKSLSPESGPQQVIVLNDAFISIWPRTVSPQDETPIPDGSLFTKKTCISIWKKNTAKVDESHKLRLQNGGPSDQFFIYVDNNCDKEDWYFALIQATKLGKKPENESDRTLFAETSAQTAHFKTSDILYLIQTLNSTEGQHSSQWFNALVGRLFLSLQQTDGLANFLREKIYKKLKKINKPGFLNEFSIERVDVGNCAPVITDPKLLDLTPEGLTRISFEFLYAGNLHLIIATKMNLNFGSRFKKREVDIKLSITVKRIEGPVVIHIKPPPTNRIWYSFQTEPLIDIDVEPIVSTRQFAYNMVTNMIKSKFKESIKESIVLPFMDDFVFYKTTEEIYRGGIWKQAETEPEGSIDQELDEANDVSKLKTKASSETFNESGFREKADLKSFSSFDGLSNRGKEDGLGLGLGLNSPTETDKNANQGESMRFFLKEANTDDSNNSITSKSSNDSISSSNNTKKYLQTGIKKFGRWYKDQVTSVKGSLSNENESMPSGSVDLETTHINEEITILQEETKTAKTTDFAKVNGPEMISNRRTPRNRPFVPEGGKPETSPHQPEFHRADMFVNRDRASSTSGSYIPSSPNAESYRRYDMMSPNSYGHTNYSENVTHSPSSTTEHSASLKPAVHIDERKLTRPPPPPLPPR